MPRRHDQDELPLFSTLMAEAEESAAREVVPGVKHEVILASAGSGKTYALTGRFIHLMARGVRPESILALTFTRKAAGEFFDAILLKLAKAAQSKVAAARLAEDIGCPEATAATFRGFLRRLVDSMHRLSLGTLDSFFLKILRAFPFEFGLGGEFALMDEATAALEQERVFEEVLGRGREFGEAEREFLAAFQQATYGRQEAALSENLARFLDDCQHLYLLAPEQEKWGDPACVWPAGHPLVGRKEDLPARVARLRQIRAGLDVTEKQEARWADFLAGVESHAPGAPLPKPVMFLLEKLLPELPRLGREEVVFKTDRQDNRIDTAQGREIEAIVSHLFGSELRSALERTRGLWLVTHACEEVRDRLLRRRGQLTFSDVQVLLARHREAEPFAHLNMEYRLDQRHDHWLLDEFQDTSLLQWSVLENLVDEIITDDSGRRSYFQVGDEKQAIYAWRGGEARLAREILAQYNTGHGEPRLPQRFLNDSWRSGPPIIEMVNGVFGDRAVMSELFPASAVDRWEWHDHVSARPDHTGCATLLRPVESEELEAEEAEFEVIARVLRDLRPLARGLTCAVLVRSNDKVRAAANYLRAADLGVPVAIESDLSIASDNPLCTALLSLVKFAAHPGDTFAWEHVRMTPLRSVLDEKTLGPEGASLFLLQQIHEGGFEHLLRWWLNALPPLDPFSHGRGEALVDLARLFDQSGSRDCDAFLTYANSAWLKEAASPSAIQVMTWHKSKGLGFDVVFLPCLPDGSLTTTQRELARQTRGSRETAWVMAMPLSEIVDADATLTACREERAAGVCYENFCNLYVAMTRAKRALYVINKEPSAKSTARNFRLWLDESLAGDSTQPVPAGGETLEAAALFGEWDWFSIVPETAPVRSRAPRAASRLQFPARPRLTRRTPSGSETHTLTARQLFSPATGAARGYGTLVHAIFEQIEWSGTMTTLEAWWRETHPAPEKWEADAWTEAIAALAEPSVAAALAKPAGPVQLWRERSFEIILGGQWITGTFDRVVIGQNSARILDFKTDTVPDEAALPARIAGYRPQLTLYRQVLARLTGLPESAISTALIFTKLRRVVEVN